MCGIAGIIGPPAPEMAGIVRDMGRCMAHRGPDADGFWGGPFASVAHRRLAIIDLSEDGRQPMTDPDTGNVIVFNGEIYNYKVLRGELAREGVRFRTKSDTEVI